MTQSRAFKVIRELNKKHRGDWKAIIKELTERSRHADTSLQPGPSVDTGSSEGTSQTSPPLSPS